MFTFSETCKIRKLVNLKDKSDTSYYVDGEHHMEEVWYLIFNDTQLEGLPVSEIFFNRFIHADDWELTTNDGIVINWNDDNYCSCLAYYMKDVDNWICTSYEVIFDDSDKEYPAWPNRLTDKDVFRIKMGIFNLDVDKDK